MDEFLADLKPVSTWNFRLWKIVWRNNHTGQTKTLWCVNTDTHLADECQRRWPGNYYHEYMEYDMGEAPRPPQVGAYHGMRLDEDSWTYGERLRAERNL